MKVIIAIDPGVSGGVAVSALGKTLAYAMPETEGDRLELLRGFKTTANVEGADCVCVLEEVNGFVGKAQPGSAMFKFGAHYGFLKGVTQALGIRLVLVRPQVWQRVFGLGTAASCANSREWKNKLKAEAQRRFPELNVTLKTADALLILEWAKHFQPQMDTDKHGCTSPLPSAQRGEGEEFSTAHVVTSEQQNISHK